MKLNEWSGDETKEEIRHIALLAVMPWELSLSVSLVVENYSSISKQPSSITRLDGPLLLSRKQREAFGRVGLVCISDTVIPKLVWGNRWNTHTPVFNAIRSPRTHMLILCVNKAIDAVTLSCPSVVSSWLQLAWKLTKKKIPFFSCTEIKIVSGFDFCTLSLLSALCVPFDAIHAHVLWITQSWKAFIKSTPFLLAFVP